MDTNPDTASDTNIYISGRHGLYLRPDRHRLFFVNDMHLSWSSILSAGMFVAMNPWSSTLFRAIGCWAARVGSREWARPVALIFMLFLVSGSMPLQAQYRRRPATGRGMPGKPADDVLSAAVASFKGKLRSVGKKEILIESDEEQMVSFHRSKKTKFLDGTKEIKPGDIPLESMVTVEASKDAVGDLVAVDVIWKKS